jgi:hypothetical protein
LRGALLSYYKLKIFTFVSVLCGCSVYAEIQYVTN